MEGINLKHLRIVEVGHLDPVKRQIGVLSSNVEYKLRNPNSERHLITDQEVFERLREIIKLLEKL